jgi:hypothetical protein
MERLAIAILLTSSYCCAQSPGGFSPASTNVWGAAYPRVDASGRAQFRIKAPNATAVKLNFWSNPKLDMVKETDGFWTATTAPLVPGFHYYNFVIDGVDVNDAGSHAFYGGGRDASGIEIPEPGADYYLPQDTSPKSPATGDMPSCMFHPNTIRRRRRAIRCSICSMEAAKMRQDGSSRVVPTSYWTT